MLLNSLVFNNLSSGGKKSFFKEKNPKASQSPYFFLILLLSQRLCLGPSVIDASKSVCFPHIYTSLHYYFIMKLSNSHLAPARS